MLDGILGRGFTSKCKSLIKVIKSRIDVIRRKKSATLKFLKKDIADLLANGLDINAYGRVEGYIAELTLSCCYDFVEKCCDFVSKHVSVMQKLSDCPEDCREAVASLMFAAARFSDLPELRDLRQIFHERYGNSLELFVNKQLVENSASNPSKMEKKVKVMHDIASEFSINWNSEAFERRMSKPTVIPQDQPKNDGSFNVNGDKHKSNDGKSADPQGDKPKVSAGKLEFWNGKDDVALKTARLSSSSYVKRMERVEGEVKLKDSRENRVPRIDNQDVLPQGKPDLDPSYAAPQLKSHDKDLFAANNYAGQYNVQNSTRKAHEEDEPKWKPYFNSGIPPPYVKPNIKPKHLKHGASEGSSHAGFDSNGVSADPSTHNRAYAVNRTDKYQEGLYYPDKEGQIIPPTKVISHDCKKDYYYNHDGSNTPIPRQRLSRRRHLKSPSGHNGVDNVEDTEFARRKPRSRRRDDSRRGLQILFDDEQHRNDEEERIIDKLLMHYSKKPSSCDEGKVRRKSKSRHAHHMGSDVGEVPQKASRDRSDDMSKTISHPARSISLPHEQTAQSEGTKVYARAISFQQDSSNAARHVHPKLPDYDDLAAHFAAMKGR
ncbi:Vacuolar protein sorting-associated protein Ist1 - like 10 [Theobroma cacao]|nr:Vacuolar protein sorting-associated protein Ist1 - like 10 [Theobroma cacao]